MNGRGEKKMFVVRNKERRHYVEGEEMGKMADSLEMVVWRWQIRSNSQGNQIKEQEGVKVCG